VRKWESQVERQIREAMEQGAFDNLPGMGKPLDLGENPFEEPLAGTMRRILRDNGVTHPLIEVRRSLESEVDAARTQLYSGRVDEFRATIRSLNREIKLFNLRSPIPNFHLRVVDIEREVEAYLESRKTN
jgi:DnaJ homolog subfamily C member 28